jgi:hypothetical protein
MSCAFVQNAVAEAADAPVAPRGLLEVEVREGVRLRRARRHADRLQQPLADQVRQPARHVAHPEVHARLAKAHRHELRVAVGHVQQRHVAEGRQVVQAALRDLRVGLGVAAERQACGRGHAEQVDELPAGQVHGARRRRRRVWATG